MSLSITCIALKNVNDTKIPLSARKLMTSSLLERCSLLLILSCAGKQVFMRMCRPVARKLVKSGSPP